MPKKSADYLQQFFGIRLLEGIISLNHQRLKGADPLSRKRCRLVAFIWCHSRSDRYPSDWPSE